MKVGNRVKTSPLETKLGTITQIRKDGYIVVIWDNTSMEWHYTKDQTENIEIVESR